MKKYLLIVIVCFYAYAPGFSQVQDTVVISFSEFMSGVAEKHPHAKLAGIEPILAEKNLQSARGGFDPVLFSDYDEKFFDSKNYYKQFSAGIKIPTWYGIAAKTGYDFSSGLYLNPENTLPATGLQYLGLSVPLGQNLFFDSRRARLRQARINTFAAENQKYILLNSALVKASEAFWQWNNAWEKYKVYEEVFNLAKVRYEFTVKSYLLGDKAAIDTVEAFSVYNQRKNQLIQMRLEFQNQGYQLNDYLWVENIPVQNAVPDSDNNSPGHDPEISAETIALNHPEIKNYALKLDALQVEKRLKAEKLKPKLNVNYNILTHPVNINERGSPIFSANNYKWGFEFSFPLLVREGRADLQIAKLKIRQQQLLMDQKKAELINKTNIVLNLLNNVQSQIALQQQSVSALEKLLTGERTLFEAGETFLFLVNSREAAYLDAQMKLIDLRTKYYIYYYQLQYLKGEPLALWMKPN